MRKEKILLAVLIDLIILFLFVLFLPQFKINNSISLVGEPYIPEVKIYNIFKDLTDKTIVKNNVNINKVGEYSVECKIRYLFLDIKKVFSVEIKDDLKPSISLVGNDTASVCPGKEYTEEGYKAIDNYDGDITDKVNIEKNDNSILYSVLIVQIILLKLKEN